MARSSRPRPALSRRSSLVVLLALMLVGAAAVINANAAASTARLSSISSRCLFIPPHVRAAPAAAAAAAAARGSALTTTAVRTTTAGTGPLGFVVARPAGRSSRSRSLVRRAALPPTALQDIGGAALVAGAAGVWLKLWTALATAGKVDSKDSRKIIHCGSGPLFLLCWPFFSADPSARLFAAAVPLLQIVAVAAAGLSKPAPDTDATLPTTPAKAKKPSGLVAAISRSGNPAEVLRGPLIYVFVLLFATLLCWRTSPVGLVAVAQMAAGDGMADIVGRRWGGRKWPFSATKSYAGTAAFALFGFLVSLGLLAWFHAFALLPAALTLDVVLRVGAVSVACALIELVPLGDDNVTVPAAAALLSMLLLR